MTPTAAELGYLAAMIDGEGCIHIDRSQHHRLRVNVVNTSTALMGWLIQRFGGNFVLNGQKRSPKACFVWVVYGTKAAELLQMVEPILVIKQKRARVAIALQMGRKGTNKISAMEAERRNAVYSTFKETKND